MILIIILIRLDHDPDARSYHRTGRHGPGRLGAGGRIPHRQAPQRERAGGGCRLPAAHRDGPAGHDARGPGLRHSPGGRHPRHGRQQERPGRRRLGAVSERALHAAKAGQRQAGAGRADAHGGQRRAALRRQRQAAGAGQVQADAEHRRAQPALRPPRGQGNRRGAVVQAVRGAVRLRLRGHGQERRVFTCAESGDCWPWRRPA